MRIKGVHHVAIAVRDLEEARKRWSALFGAEADAVEELPERGVRLVHLRFAGGAEIELIAPLGEASPVSKFLESRGEGIQHLTFEVDDIERAMDELSRAGLQLLSARPQVGSEGDRIAFIHPRDLNGVLVEIREGRKSGAKKASPVDG